MLSDKELQILYILRKRLLMRKEELVRNLEKEGINADVSTIQRLKDMGYVNMIDLIGSLCYALTQNGMKVLKENRS
jgi:arginine repressor